MTKFIARFAKDESGATAIEYALVATIIGVGIIAALGTFRTSLNTKFNSVGASVTNAK